MTPIPILKLVVESESIDKFRHVGYVSTVLTLRNLTFCAANAQPMFARASAGKIHASGNGHAARHRGNDAAAGGDAFGRRTSKELDVNLPGLNVPRNGAAARRYVAVAMVGAALIERGETAAGGIDANLADDDEQ